MGVWVRSPRGHVHPSRRLPIGAARKLVGGASEKWFHSALVGPPTRLKNKPWSFGASAHRIIYSPRLMPALRHLYAISVSVSLIYNFESLSLYQNSKSPKHYGYRSFSNDSRAVTCNGRQKLTFIFIFVYTFVYILIYTLIVPAVGRWGCKSVGGWVVEVGCRCNALVVHVSDGVSPQTPGTKAWNLNVGKSFKVTVYFWMYRCDILLGLD